MFNQKKLGAQRYKDESKAVNSEETDRVKNQFGLWSSIQGHTSETGCQLPGTEQGAVLDGLSADESVARGSDALQQRVCRTGDGEGSIGIQAARASAVAIVRHGAYRSEKFSLLARAASRRGRRPG
jgi:hypothetical protein